MRKKLPPFTVKMKPLWQTLLLFLFPLGFVSAQTLYDFIPLSDEPTADQTVVSFRPQAETAENGLFSRTEWITGPQVTESSESSDAVIGELFIRGQEPAQGTLPIYYLPQEETPATNQTFYGPPLPEQEYPVTLNDQWVDSASTPFESQFLPEGFIYPSYLAGRKEPRLQSVFTNEDGYGWLWDITLGSRVPLYRFGTADPIAPEGFQIDMEGAALLRLDFERDRELAATDYRAGLPLTYGTRHWQYKFAYYHVSSHLGDQYLIDRFREKKHYVRDELVLGLAWRPYEPVRVYGEAGWAFNTGDTTEPWEFQLGAEYSPVYHPETAKSGTPFAAVHGHLFEELDFGGYLNIQIGWQWRSRINSRFRLGAEFYDGCDDQFQFHALYQRKYGIGFWYDF